MFDTVCKLYYKEGNPKPKHKSVIEEMDMKRLGVYFRTWRINAIVLCDAVWFTLCFHFGRRGRAGWVEIKKDSYLL